MNREATFTAARSGASRLTCALALAVGSVVASMPAVASPVAAAPPAQPTPSVSLQAPGDDAELTVPQTLVSTVPARFVETRPGFETFDGQYESAGLLTAGTEYRVQIAGRGLVPADAVGVVANITAIEPESAGYITVHPCASPRPLASSVNYVGGTTVGNELVASLATDGSLCIFVLRSMHVALDVVGFVPNGSDVHPLLPARLLDTRDDGITSDGDFEGVGRADAGSTTKFRVAGRAGVPNDADSVIVNVTAVGARSTGYAVVHACLATVPGGSSLNYVAGVDRGNELVVDVDANGDICVFTLQDLDIVVDVVAYVPPGSTVASVVPSRLAESRAGLPTVDTVSAGVGRLPAGNEYELQVTGRAGIPNDARAAIVNVTAINPDHVGFFTMHPCAAPRPLASSLNYSGGIDSGNELISGLSPTGSLCLYTSAAADFVVDVVGYLADSAAPLADMTVTSTTDVDPVVAGNALTYTITATNNGPADAENVEVTTVLPTGTTLVQTVGCDNDPATGGICELGSIAAGTSEQYTVEVLVDAALTGTITNSVTVRSDTGDSNTGNNTATATTTVNGGANLSVTVTDDADPVIAADTVTYTVTVANAGPLQADDVVATETLPAGVTLISTSGCAEDPVGVPTCTLGSITSGNAAQYTVTVTVDAGVSGTVTNSVSVASSTFDPHSADNTASEDTVVSPVADLSLTKSDDVDPVTPGDTFTYTLTVSNAGPHTADDVVVTDTLPAGVTLDSTTGCAEDPAGTPTCTLGSITSGSSAQYSVTVTVDAGLAASTIQNSATVASSTHDPVTANNTVIEPTTVLFFNDAPAFTKGADQTIFEDAAAQTVTGWATAISPGPTDESAQTVTFNITGNTNPALFTAGPAINSSGTLTYTPATDANGTATITIAAQDNGGTANGGNDTSPTQTFDITITPVNDAPTFTKGADQAVSFVDGAQTIDPWATGIAVGPADEAGQTITFDITGNTNPALFTVAPAVDSSGVLTFTPDPGLAAGGTATITIEAQDDGGTANGGADTSPSQTFDITVSIDEAPSVSTIAPADAATGVAAGANLVITFDEAVTLTGDWVTVTCGATTYTPSGTGTDVALSVTDNDPVFTLDPAADFPDGTTCDVTVTAARVGDDDLIDPPDSMLADFTSSFTVAPRANDDAYDSLGNVGIAPASADGLILGTGADGGTGLTVATVQGAAANVGTATATTASGYGGQKGSVTVAGDGGFVYSPPPGFVGDDTFTYTVSDGSSTSSAATVTITVTDTVWFIDSSAVSSDDQGTLAEPFTTIAAFNAMNSGAAPAPQPGHTIFLATGTGDYTGPIALRDGQILIGQAATAAIAPVAGLTVPAFSRPLPSTSGTAPIITAPAYSDGVRLATDNTVRGLDIGDTEHGAGLTGVEVGALRVSDLSISGVGAAVALRSSTAAVIDVTIDELAAVSSSQPGIDLLGLGGTFEVTGAAVVASSGTAHGVHVVTSTAAFNGGLDVTAESGPAVFATASTLTVSDTGVERISAPVGGISLWLAGVTVGAAGITFDQIDSGTVGLSDVTGGAITLTTVDLRSSGFSSAVTIGGDARTSAVHIGPGTIENKVTIAGSGSGAVTIDADVSGTVRVSDRGPGSGPVAFNGAIAALGKAVAVHDNSAGRVDFNGSITVGLAVAAGVGIDLDDNTGTSDNNFNGPIDINANDSGIEMVNSNADFIGGLAIVSDRTAFSATGGGTVTVSGPAAATLRSDESTAARIVDTVIGAAGVTFQSITAGDGRDNAIVVDNTGTSGSFQVTGVGTLDGSGGTIGDRTGSDGSVSAGTAIHLDQTVNARFANMTLSGTYANHALRATTIDGLTLTNVDVTGTSGNSPGIGEGGVRLANVTGNVVVTESAFSGATDDTFSIDNSSGSVVAGFVGNTFGPNDATNGDNGLRFVTSGSATGHLSVNGNAFTGAQAHMLFVDIGGTGGGNVDIGGTTANTFTQNQTNLSGGGAIRLFASGSGNVAAVDATVSNNTVLAGTHTFEGDTIVVGTDFGYAGTLDLTMVGNQVGTSGVNGSAVNPAAHSGDSGIVLTSNGTGAFTALVRSNSVYDYNGSGFEVLYDAEGPSDPLGGSVDLTVTDNSFADVVGVGGLANAAFFIFGGDDVDVCLDARSNTLSNPAGLEIGVDVFAGARPFRAPGLINFTEAGLAGLLAGQNGVTVADVDVYAPGQTFGGGACTLP